MRFFGKPNGRGNGSDNFRGDALRLQQAASGVANAASAIATQQQTRTRHLENALAANT